MPKSNALKSGRISVSFYLTLTSNPWDKPLTAWFPLSPPCVQYPKRPLDDAEMCTTGRWSCWVWNKENKVMISLSDIWLWVLNAPCVVSKGWSLASNRDCRHLLSSIQRQITKTRSDLFSLCSSIPKERQVPGHCAPSQQYINSLHCVKGCIGLWLKQIIL